MKAYGDLGLRCRRIKLMGAGHHHGRGVAEYGDAPLGSSRPGGYSEAATRRRTSPSSPPEKRDYGPNSHANFMGVDGWTDGAISGNQGAERKDGRGQDDGGLARWKNPDSRAGDRDRADTRDIIQNIYIRRVERRETTSQYRVREIPQSRILEVLNRSDYRPSQESARGS